MTPEELARVLREAEEKAQVGVLTEWDRLILLSDAALAALPPQDVTYTCNVCWETQTTPPPSEPTQ